LTLFPNHHFWHFNFRPKKLPLKNVNFLNFSPNFHRVLKTFQIPHFSS
jgi:hypothetical protein